MASGWEVIEVSNRDVTFDENSMIKGKAQVDDWVSDHSASKQVELECESSDKGKDSHEQPDVEEVLDSNTESDAPQEQLYSIARERPRRVIRPP